MKAFLATGKEQASTIASHESTAQQDNLIKQVNETPFEEDTSHDAGSHLQIRHDDVEVEIKMEAPTLLEDSDVLPKNLHPIISRMDIGYLESKKGTLAAVISPKLKDALVQMVPGKLQNIHCITPAPLYKERQLTSSLFKKMIGKDD